MTTASSSAWRTAEMNSRQRVLAALRLEQPDRVPFVEGDISPVIERALLGKDIYQPEEVNEVMGLAAYHRRIPSRGRHQLCSCAFVAHAGRPGQAGSA